jgi:hypothetical protein
MNDYFGVSGDCLRDWHNLCWPDDCECACHIRTHWCGRCGVEMASDPTGMCDDCNSELQSARPGSITKNQREALIGLLMDQGLVGSTKARAAVISQVVKDWRYGGDLGALSQREAADLLEHLEERRR